jgi:hypothetical protein
LPDKKKPFDWRDHPAFGWDSHSSDLPPLPEFAEVPEAKPQQVVLSTVTPDLTGPKVAADRERRLKEFISTQRVSIAAVDRAAKVAKPDRQEWRKGKMSDSSVMARRIEDVLAGRTPLLGMDTRKVAGHKPTQG